MIGEIINIAEHTTYLELVSRVCYYDEPNLNNDMLPYDDTTEEKAKTLINMPVQAKYRVSPSGEPTFSGHEMVKKKDGTVDFKTSSIGTHTEVYIKNDNVDVNGTIKELPCLFAKYRIWKRYKNVVAAVQRLFDLGKLYSSWEIYTYEYVYNKGIRKVTDYEFQANCLLGYEYAYPSYGTSANAISMSEMDNNSPQLMIAEALSQDLIDKNDNKEEKARMIKKNEVDKQNADTTSAQLTTRDLREKLGYVCGAKIGGWCYVSYMFPNEKEVWCEYYGAKTELDYVKFTYEVGEDDSITVSEPEYVKLSVSIAEINSKVSSLEKEIETLKAELDIKNTAITKASEKIQELNIQISELTPYKKQVETAEQERIEAKISEDKARLREKMLKGNLFTEAEIAEKNIADLIEARNESAINSLIADKFVASINNKEFDDTTQIAENTEMKTVTASLEIDEDTTDARSFMRSILFDK